MFADSNAYERFMGRWSRLAAPLLVEFSRIPESGHILDIGTGTGWLAATIAERTRCSVTGVDISQQYIAYARAARGSDRVRFEIGDAQRLGFPDRSFDGVVSLLVFNFIPDPRAALAEARRVSRGGAIISAAVWDYAEGMQMLRIFWDAAVAVDGGAVQYDENRMKLCRRGELSRLWKEGGLVEVEEKPLDVTMGFESFADYWEPFLLAQGPAGAYVKRLSPGQVERLRGEVLRRLPLNRENARFILTGRAWAVRGRSS